MKKTILVAILAILSFGANAQGYWGPRHHRHHREFGNRWHGRQRDFHNEGRHSGWENRGGRDQRGGRYGQRNGFNNQSPYQGGPNGQYQQNNGANNQNQNSGYNQVKTGQNNNSGGWNGGGQGRRGNRR